MAAPCQGEFSTLAPLASGCPADNEQILFINVAGQTGGYAFRTWGSVKQCLYNQLFSNGIIMFTGADLNGSNKYIPPSGNPLSGFNLIVYYQGQGFLTYNSASPSYPNSTWAPDIVGGVSGVQILIPGTYTSADLFLIFINGPQTF
jgi:hypothetical protein